MGAIKTYAATIEYNRPFLLAFIYGLCIGLAFAVEWIIPLSLISLVLLFRLWSVVQSLRISILIGSIVWTVKILFATAFIWDIYPIYWLADVSSALQLGAIAAAWLLYGLAGIIAGGLFGVSIFYFHIYVRSRWLFVPGIALVWVFMELIQTVTYSLFVIGPSVPMQLALSFGYIGYILAAIPGLYYLAFFGGVYTLSFFTVVIGYMVGYAIGHFSRWFVIIPIIKITLASWFVSYIIVYQPQGIILAAIETSFRLDDAGAEISVWTDRFYATHAGVMEAMSHDADFILLPEDSRYYQQLSEYTYDPYIQWSLFQQRSFGGIIIDPTRAETSGGAIARAYYYHMNKQIAAQDKYYLTPHGEYQSYWLRWLWQKNNISVASEAVFGDYLASSIFETYNGNSAELPVTVFCSEAMSPTVVRERLNQLPEAPFVFHPMSHAWFWNEDRIMFQIDRMLRVHAIWNQIPVVAVPNMGIIKVYYPDGRIDIPALAAGGVGWRLRVFGL